MACSFIAICKQEKAAQPAHLHSLISTFAVRFLDNIIHILAKNHKFQDSR